MATHIKHLIANFLHQHQYNIKIKKTIDDILRKVTHKKLHSHFKIGRIYKDRLILYVDCSIVRYELNLLKEKILKEVNKTYPQIKTVVLKTKNIDEW